MRKRAEVTLRDLTGSQLIIQGLSLQCLPAMSHSLLPQILRFLTICEDLIIFISKKISPSELPYQF